MFSRGRVTGFIYTLLFGKEHAETALHISFILCILALILILCWEWAVYKSRAGKNASWKGFRRFQKAYPEEKRQKAEARRREREARKEARRREKETQKENKE